MATLNKVRKSQTVTQKTYKRLARAIAKNKLLPGQQLVADSLAGELGVSRTPVREALLILEREGLVEVVPGAGAFVKGLDLSDLLELFEFREVIELHSVKRAIASPKKSLLDKLKSRLEEHRDPKTPAEVEAAAEADLAMHHALVSALGNKLMLASWEKMATQMRRFWVDGRSVPGRARIDIEECLAILTAIENLDSERGLQLMKDHLDTSRRSLIEWRRGLE